MVGAGINIANNNNAILLRGEPSKRKLTPWISLEAQRRDLGATAFVIEFHPAKNGKPVEEPLADITEDFPK